MKPTLFDFEFAYCGMYYDENDCDIYEKPNDRFNHEFTQTEYGQGDENYDETIVLYDTVDNEFWGLLVSHNSWHEEPFTCLYSEDEIDMVEKRPITETRWVFE